MAECVNCGYCCTKAPCVYGQHRYHCKRGFPCPGLTADNLCEVYLEGDEGLREEMEGIMGVGIGAGCCSPMFNTMREAALKKRAKKNPKKMPMGECYSFAAKKAIEWETSGGDPAVFKLIHGRCTDKWNGESYLHAWVEIDDKVFDWQTGFTKPEGIARDVFYDYYQPEAHRVYTAEEAVSTCLKAGQWGPWENPGLYHNSAKKDLKQLFKKLRKLDWVIDFSKHGWKLTSPTTGRKYFTGASPSDTRMIIRLKKDLAKIGPVPNPPYPDSPAVGTRFYHGTSSPVFEDTPDGPAWFSTAPSVADWFVTYHEWGDDGGPKRILTYEVIDEPKLFVIATRDDMDDLAIMHGYPVPADTESVIEAVRAAGYDGWIIPDNYPDGDDIMLLEPSEWLAQIETEEL